MTPHNVNDPIGITGERKRNGILLIFFSHGQGGHDDNLMGIDSTGLMGLGTPDHNPVLFLFHNAEKMIGIRLLVGGKAPVAFGIGHGPVTGQVVFLDVFKIFQEPLEVTG